MTKEVGLEELEGERKKTKVRFTEEEAAIMIQRRLYRNLDPISYLVIRRPVTLVRNDLRHHYEASTLFDYIEKTGDMKDPKTRQTYSNQELSLIETAVGKKITRSKDKEEREEVLNSLITEIVDAERRGLNVSEETMMDSLHVLRGEEERRWFEERLAEERQILRA